jgi:hypothetical protein
MIVGSNILAGASGQAGYFLNRSVRLRSSASAYFSRTPASAGSRTTMTFSWWTKLDALGAVERLFSANATTSDDFTIYFGGNTIAVYNALSSTSNLAFQTTDVFRDPASWYHFVVAIDTTQAINTNRFKLYVNGLQLTSFSTLLYPAQNALMYWNTATTHAIGRNNTSAIQYFDGYLTEINFIDGQALTPTSFGEYNTLTGVWQPKKYVGTYGTNGFYLNFNDNSAATAAAIGKDSSGNGNNWTPNNISLTAGANYDSMTDVPTLTSPTTANYCVINPLGTGVPSFKNSTSLTISDGNLSYSKPSGTGYFGALGSFAMPLTGNWYWEFTPTTNVITCGISVGADYASSGEFGVRVDNTSILVNGSSVQTGLSGLAVNNVIGCAWNADTNSFQFYKNGSTYGTAVSFTPASGASYYPYLMNQGTGLSVVANANFGQRPFSYTPPTGFVALNTYNLPTPTISNGATQFAATTYTGTGAARTVTNTVNVTSMQPDFIWIKNRSSSSAHALTNSVVGITKYIESNTPNAETTDTTSVTALNSNGFNLGVGTSIYSTNTNGQSFVAWQWKASNAAAVTNTSGTGTSLVSANPTAGFSIVTMTNIPTSTGTNTYGHGLNAVPQLIICKNINLSDDWYTYNATLGNAAYIRLNSFAAQTTGVQMWGTTSPTSSVFTLRNGSLNSTTTQTILAYCFASINGYSKIGSYTGNGSSDGVFVYLGFRPRWLMIKRTDATSTSWGIYDTSRNPYNVAIINLYANLPNADSSGAANSYDLLSNGFKLRNADTFFNANGGTYIYAAFAENPFKNSLAR